MYTIQNVEINDFWSRLSVKCEFKDDVNIIIGRNGSGKTTFMNILHAVLAVDLEGLLDSEFESVVIKLNYKGRTKTIKASKKLCRTPISL